MIELFFTRFKKQLPNDVWNDHFRLLPAALAIKNQKYIRWQDRHAHLFGALLLIEGIKKYNLGVEVLNDLKYNKNNKPFLKEDFDFNISHSGEYILCAMCNGASIGVDIELIREINFNAFDSVMGKEEMFIITNSPKPLYSFFKYWTIKESVIKADGRGLSLPLQNLQINDDIVKCDNQTWYISQLNIDELYCAHLASNVAHSFRMREFDFL
jgi:4'-phosphopantetheinyl transferase